MGIVVAVTVVFALLVGVGAVVGYQTLLPRSRDAANSSFAPKMLHRSFPTVPSAAFAVGPAEVGTNFFTRPSYAIGGEESTGYLRSDRFLITGMGYGGLVALDPHDGRVAWQNTSYSGLTCSDVFDDETIGCYSSAAKRLMLLSALDGSVVADLPAGYNRVKKFGDKYAFAGTQEGTATVSLGTRTNPTAFWTHTEPIPGGTRIFLDVSNDVVAYTDGSLTGGWSFAYNEAGQRITQTTTFGSLLGDDEFTSTPGDSALVYDSTARMRYSTPSRPTQPSLYAPAPGISVAFTRTTAIDPADGRTLWSRPLAAESPNSDSGALAVVGSVAVLKSEQGPETVGVDVRTGKTLWQTQLDGVPYDLVTDGRRIIGVAGDSGHELFAVDVATGRRDWSVSLPDVGNYAKAVAVGDELVVVGSNAVVGFHPTGGTATLWDGMSVPEQSGPGGAVTPCATTPTVTPVNFAVDAQNLVVRLQFTAGCADGDVLSNSQYQLTVRDQSSVIAASTFNLSSTPIALTGNGQLTVRDFSFPTGTYYRLPSSLSGGSGSSTSVAAAGETVQSLATGTNSVAPGQSFTPPATSAGTIAGTGTTGTSTAVNSTSNAIDALRAQANADRPLVQSQYLDRWLAQISAKQVRTPPMVATDVDDRTMVAWTPEEVLRQHLSLRARYPEVRLLYADDWRTFDLRDWWITVAQPNVLDAAGANAWCDSKAIAPNQCFAKLVSNSRGSEGTTEYRR